MAAPLSRLGQITQAEALINDNTNQDISAADVRNTLTGIIDSTTGMKTIWSGTIATTYSLSVNRIYTPGPSGSGSYTYRITDGTRTLARVIENYSDPYFFPTTGGKYTIISGGSGIQGSVLQKNISTSLVLPSGLTDYRFGGGLTFDCTINTTSLTLASITVANQGAGYSSILHGTDPGYGIVELNFPLFAAKPVVKIQLGATVAAGTADSNSGIVTSGTGNSCSFTNIFCFNSPVANQALYKPNTGSTILEAIRPRAFSTTSSSQYLNSNNNQGFNYQISSVFTANAATYDTQTQTVYTEIEIRVPIINATF